RVQKARPGITAAAPDRIAEEIQVVHDHEIVSGHRVHHPLAERLLHGEGMAGAHGVQKLFDREERSPRVVMDLAEHGSLARPISAVQHYNVALLQAVPQTLVGSLLRGTQISRHHHVSSHVLRRSPPSIDGHQYRSMCSITNSVPSSWLTNGRILGLYIVSVRSRTRTHCMPQRVIWRMAKERPRTHMLVCTPMMSRFLIPRWRRKL